MFLELFPHAHNTEVAQAWGSTSGSSQGGQQQPQTPRRDPAWALSPHAPRCDPLPRLCEAQGARAARWAEAGRSMGTSLEPSDISGIPRVWETDASWLHRGIRTSKQSAASKPQPHGRASHRPRALSREVPGEPPKSPHHTSPGGADSPPGSALAPKHHELG